MTRSTSAVTAGPRSGSLSSTRMLRSSNTWLMPATASAMTSFRSTRAACQSARPDSIFDTSSTWLMRRVRRSGSLVMMPRNFLRCSSSTSGSSNRGWVEGRMGASGARRAQLVAHHRYEVVLEAVGLLQPLVGRAQAGGRRLELARLLLEAMAVYHRLRRVVDDRAPLLERECLFLRHRGHHDPRRGRADRARELDFDEVHQLRVHLERLLGPAPALGGGVLPEGVARHPGAEKAGEQVVEVRQRRRAAPEARPAGLAEGVDEHARLAMLLGARRGDQRNAERGGAVGEHGPDHRVRDLVEPRQAEQGERLEQADAERAVLEQP